MKCDFCEKKVEWAEEIKACEICGGQDCGDVADVIYYCEDDRKWFDVEIKNLERLIEEI